MKLGKKQMVAQQKKDLVAKTLRGGGTKADAMRAVKKQFGSGIATRDVQAVEQQVKADQAAAVEAAKPSIRSHEELKAAYAATEPKCAMRRFLLKKGDEVLEGVQFSDGHCTLHGNGGNLSFEWLDP